MINRKIKVSTHEQTGERYSNMLMGFSIEPMRERDLYEVVDIEEASGLNRWGYDAYRRELYTNQNSVMLVARTLASDGFVIGFFAGWVIEDELHVNNVAASPAHRRIGIGEALMASGIGEARLRACRFVLLEVRASNEPAQSLYRKLGFKIVGRRRDYYRLPTEDALIMKLAL